MKQLSCILSILFWSSLGFSQSGGVNTQVSPPRVCTAQGECSSVISGLSNHVFGSISMVLTQPQGQTIMVGGVCNGPCQNIGGAGTIASWSGAPSSGQVANMVYSAQIGVSPAAPFVGLAQGLSDFSKFQSESHGIYDQAKQYTDYQRGVNAQMNQQLQGQIAQMRNQSDNYMALAVANLGAQFLRDAGIEVDFRYLKELQDYNTLVNSPYAKTKTEFQGDALNETLGAIQESVQKSDYKEFIKKTESALNSNASDTVEKQYGGYLNDGVFKTEKFSQGKIQPGPFSVGAFATSRKVEGGQALRHVANEYQALWLESKGLNSLSDKQTASFLLGAISLRNADHYFRYHEEKEGYGLLEFAQNCIDFARGLSTGGSRALVEAAQLIPQMADLIWAYAEARAGRPQDLIRILVNEVTQLPHAATKFVESYRKEYQKIINGSPFDRGDAVGHFVVTYIIAEVTGGKNTTILTESLPGSFLEKFETTAKEQAVSAGSLLAAEAEGEAELIGEKYSRPSSTTVALSFEERFQLIKNRLQDFPALAQDFKLDSEEKVRSLANRWNQLKVIRENYDQSVVDIKLKTGQMLADGSSLESTARWAHGQRIDIGKIFKEQTPEEVRSLIFERNSLKPGYGEFGPSFESLMLKFGPPTEQAYKNILESAARPNATLNALFGLGEK